MKFIKVNEIKVDEAKVLLTLIESAASAYEDPAEVVSSITKLTKNLLNKCSNVALEEQAVELLLESAKVKDKKASLFKDIMNPEGK